MRKGDWMQTFTGKKFYPLDPRPEDICLDDIAHALSNVCRFGGHCAEFYSVAEHSVLVSQVVPREDRRVALLHDATEAYLVDIPRPLKLALDDYREIEEQLWRVISYRFDVPFHMPRSVKHADNCVLLAEKEALLKDIGEEWNIPGRPADVQIRALRPDEAKHEFMCAWHGISHA